MREALLAAALELFFRQGFPGTSVREVTVACNVTPGALYNHFPSKEDLLYTIIERTTAEGSGLVEAALEEAPKDPASQLLALARSSTLYHTRHRAASLVASFQYIHLPDEQRERVIARRRQQRIGLERIIDAGVRDGVFRLPEARGANAGKLAATAIANLTLRPTEQFGPFPRMSDVRLAEFHAQLALQMVGGSAPG